MRKFALHLLLPLALLFSQQAAVWHWLAHVSVPVQGAQQAEPSSRSHGDAADVCPQCLAGAHLALGLGVQAPLLPLLQARHEWAGVGLHAGVPGERPVARGRGPPSQLP